MRVVIESLFDPVTELWLVPLDPRGHAPQHGIFASHCGTARRAGDIVDAIPLDRDAEFDVNVGVARELGQVLIVGLVYHTEQP